MIDPRKVTLDNSRLSEDTKRDLRSAHFDLGFDAVDYETTFSTTYSEKNRDSALGSSTALKDQIKGVMFCKSLFRRLTTVIDLKATHFCLGEQTHDWKSATMKDYYTVHQDSDREINRAEQFSSRMLIFVFCLF